MDWEKEFAAFLIAEMEGKPPPAPVVAVIIPAEDPDESEIVTIPEPGDNYEQSEGFGPAEGHYFMIEYQDSKGATSRRRITVHTIKEGSDGSPVLAGICHERKAYRMFRADRILSCIDLDGVIYDDVPLFLHETFGLPMATLTPRPKVAKTARADAPAERHWMPLRNVAKPHATLLVALSQSDGALSEAEMAIAERHCLAVVDDAGFDLSPDEHRRMLDYIRRLRPSAPTIRESCELLFASDTETIRRFLETALELVDSDGQRHPAEVKLLDRIARDLTGVRLMA